MHFVKAHGLGNDFIILDAINEPNITLSQEKTIQMCDRHFGIGADGVLLIESSNIADIKMRIINSDGSEPEMCGNGIRCVAMYAYRKGLVKKEMTVETLAGVMRPEIVDVEKGLIRVDMGAPILDRPQIPMQGDGNSFDVVTIEDQTFELTGVSMGNPHCVIFVQDVAQLPERYGKMLEHHPLFPEKCNVEFVQKIDEGTLRMRVWERGAGITLACGTGACAALTAAVLRGVCERRATLLLDGGELVIEWEQENGHIFMTGTATLVFEGTC